MSVLYVSGVVTFIIHFVISFAFEQHLRETTTTTTTATTTTSMYDFYVIIKIAIILP